MVQEVKNLPEMQETQEIWVRPLGQKNPLEEGMATHSSFLAWRIPWTEEPGGLQSLGSQIVGLSRMTEHAHISRFKVNNKPYHFLSSFSASGTELHTVLTCSCLLSMQPHDFPFHRWKKGGETPCPKLHSYHIIWKF